ncbi:acyl-CoA dehydrogenase family protein [Ktedonobacter racemifer]|uniref:Acyl-CoA dehydrogenase domain protein n=1 Tax=Ktedonobacter racemifer DSM 44963 TaxID=485913 RepID=D6U590_KTERA|nr:acyl-CoA dehydrogenase family protein [Ktedonobacter racemifer]EFH81670.1 acyl-CoA dehydrogenase domain protein [Ktedonobacter racemifer DSM 44963]
METIHSVAEVISNRDDLIQKVRLIGKTIAQPAAASVDGEARFPHEAIDALRQARLLSLYIPRQYGGDECSFSDLIAIAQTLSQYCASTAMIWAMHQIQVACLVHHEQNSPFFQQYLREIAEHQLLLASATSEVGVGGDIRSSVAAVEQDGEGCRLFKKATTVSYGLYADGYLVTARRSPEAAPGDQVFVLLTRPTTQLEQTGTWNTFGMRGTCSPGFNITSTFPAEQVLSTSFADIAPLTMVPFSHLLWAACWQGIAIDAFARARKFMQSKARQLRTTSLPGDGRLVEANSNLQLMRSTLATAVQEYEDILRDPEHAAEKASDMGYSIRQNNVKTLASQLVIQVVQQALYICGMAGYKEDSPFSIGRHLRDAYSASLMISNDRLNTTNAALLLVHKEEA